MATTIASTEPVDRLTWLFSSRAGTTAPVLGNADRVYPYPIPGGVRAQYRNKCLDTVTGVWTSWVTSFQDVYGSAYPGSGFNFATYRIAGIVYDRSQ